MQGKKNNAVGLLTCSCSITAKQMCAIKHYFVFQTAALKFCPASRGIKLVLRCLTNSNADRKDVNPSEHVQGRIPFPCG